MLCKFTILKLVSVADSGCGMSEHVYLHFECTCAILGAENLCEFFNKVFSSHPLRGVTFLFWREFYGNL